MSIEKHYKEFARVVKENDLDSPDKAEEVAHYITSGTVSAADFGKKFGISEEDAKAFLDFVMKGVKFKEEHIDGKN